MEGWFSLGCTVDKSSTTLRLTSDPRRRRKVAAFWAASGSGMLLMVILASFSHPEIWKLLILFGGMGISSLAIAFFTGLCRTEIEFDLPHGQIVRRRLVLGRVWSISILPLDRFKGIRAVEVPTGDADANADIVGRLELLRADETTVWGDSEVWTDWQFPTVSLAEEVRDEIRAWLEECSAYSLPRRYRAGTNQHDPQSGQRKPLIRQRLGACLLEKTSTTLRLTHDAKWRRKVACFFASIAAVGVLVSLLGFLSSDNVDRGMLVRLGIWLLVFLLPAFFLWNHRREIEVDLSQSRIIHRFLFMGLVLSVSTLPLSQLKTIRLGGKGSVGVLEWVRTDGKTWQRWSFLYDVSSAIQARREILAWLRERSAYAALEEVTTGPQE